MVDVRLLHLDLLGGLVDRDRAYWYPGSALDLPFPGIPMLTYSQLVDHALNSPRSSQFVTTSMPLRSARRTYVVAYVGHQPTRATSFQYHVARFSDDVDGIVHRSSYCN